MNPLRFCGSFFVILAVMITSLTGLAFGGAIVQVEATAASTFARDLGSGISHTTFAQSFTAEDSVIASIGFALTDANEFLGELEFTVTLFQGEGTGGRVLASVTRAFASLPSSYPTWDPTSFVDFDFSAVSLVPGQVYTAKIESTSNRGEIYESYFLGDVYPGGIAYHNDTPFFAPNAGATGPGDVQLEDLVFRVLPGSVSVTEVNIDIRPGSAINSVQPRSRGRISVAIMTTATLDATTVDWTTVRFGATGTEAVPVQTVVKDVNHDEFPDLLLYFDTEETGLQCGDILASLTGQTFDGQLVEGSDSVIIVGCAPVGLKKNK